MIHFSKCRSIIGATLAVVETPTAGTVWAQHNINVYRPGYLPFPARRRISAVRGWDTR